MIDFIETTLSAKGLQVITPKRTYGFGTPQGSVFAYDVGSASVVESEDETVCDILEITGTVTSSKTVQMYLNTSTLKGNKLYKVNFSVASGSGGPYTVTFSTGIASKQNVVIPVIASTSTLTSPKYMLFDLYVDAQGNVSSSAWEVSGSNANGSWTQFDDGTMATRKTFFGVLSGVYVSVSWTFPAPFTAIPDWYVNDSFSGGAGYAYAQYNLSESATGVSASFAEIELRDASGNHKNSFFALGNWR
jgi:hypothetical protein